MAKAVITTYSQLSTYSEILYLDSFCSDVALYCSYAAVICLSFYVLFLILFYLCAIAVRSYDRKFQINIYLLETFTHTKKTPFFKYKLPFTQHAVPKNNFIIKNSPYCNL